MAKRAFSTEKLVRLVAAICNVKWPPGFSALLSPLAGTDELLRCLGRDRPSREEMKRATDRMVAGWNKYTSAHPIDAVFAVEGLRRLSIVYQLIGLTMPQQVQEAADATNNGTLSEFERIIAHRSRQAAAAG